MVFCVIVFVSIFGVVSGCDANDTDYPILGVDVDSQIVSDNQSGASGYHISAEVDCQIVGDNSIVGECEVHDNDTINRDDLLGFSNEDDVLKGVVDVYSYDDLKNNIANNIVLNIRNDLSANGLISIQGFNNLTIIGNGFTIDGLSMYKIFDINSDCIVLKDIHFKNCYYSGMGGALSLLGSDNLVESCSFDSCQNNDHASVMNTGGSFKIIKCNFTNNYCKKYEACVNLGGDFYMSDCIFRDNRAHRWNGAIRMLYANGVINNTLFEHNYCDMTGSNAERRSAIGFYGGVNCNITNCDFINNPGYYGGALSNHQGAILNIVNCNFIDNSATVNGGAIYINSPNSKIANCTFSGNSARNGGAVYLNGNYNTLVDCNFTDNIASGSAGALYFNAQYGNLTGCDFVDNRGMDAGAISFVGSNNEINYCSFVNNSASNNGGAVVSSASGSHVNYCAFENNTAGNLGDSFYQTNMNTQIIFTGTYFPIVYMSMDNAQGDGLSLNTPARFDTAIQLVKAGSILYVVGGISDNFTTKNVSTDSLIIKGYNSSSVFDGLGNRIFNILGDNIKINNLIFSNIDISSNVDGNGSAIKVMGDNLEISNCSFVSNCGVNGGAVYVTNGSNILVINSSVFRGNSAVCGGGVYVSYTNNSLIYNTTFRGNVGSVAGGALFYQTPSTMFYYVDNVTNSSITYGSVVGDNDLFTGGAYACSMEVYVEHNDTNPHPEYSGLDRDHPLNNIRSAFALVAPGGTVYFIHANETWDYYVNPDYRDDGGRGFFYKNRFAKFGVSFLGNNTTLRGVDFICDEKASGVKISGFNFVDSVCACEWNGNGGVISDCKFINNGNCSVDDDVVSNALVVSGAGLVINGSDFINNHALSFNQSGGAIYCSGVNLTMVNCIFFNNSASNMGCHVYLSNSSGNVSIVGCSFVNGSFVVGDGSGIVIFGGNVSLVSCLFVNNSGCNGSAVYINSSGVSIVDSFFACPKFDENNNVIRGYVYSYGDGGVFLFNNTLSFADLDKVVCEAVGVLDLEFNYKFFDGCDVGFVSGVVVGSDLVVNGNGFVLDGDYCARIFNISSGNVVFSNLGFCNGNAVFGGGLYCVGNVTLVDCNFTCNNASCGGVIFIESGCSNFSNCVFKGNNASNGSVIYIVSSVNYWSNLDFVGNVASVNGSVYFREDSTVYCGNLSFSGNVVANGLQVVGEDHIFAPVLYVGLSCQGFGVIGLEPCSLDRGVDNILPDGRIILLSDSVLKDSAKCINIHNITVVGNTYSLSSDKYLFILKILV